MLFERGRPAPLRNEAGLLLSYPSFFGGALPLSVGLQIINPATVDSPKGNNRMGDYISFFSGILPSAGLVVSHPEVFPPMVKERKNTHENFAIYSIITTFADRKKRRNERRKETS